MKKLSGIFLCILLVLHLAVPAFAADEETAFVIGDRADILSDTQLSALNERGSQIRESYGITAIVIITDTLYGYSPEQYAETAQKTGSLRDGILLLIATDSRDYCLYAFDKGTAVFTDYGLAKLEKEILPHLKNDDFYEGFAAYFDAIPCYCEAYGKGEPIDRSFGITHVLIALVIGLAIGGITIAVMRAAMNTARAKPSATEYVCPGSFRPYGNFDMYLYSRISKTRKQSNSSGGHGGGSGGGGGSSRSRSGKF